MKTAEETIEFIDKEINAIELSIKAIKSSADYSERQDERFLYSLGNRISELKGVKDFVLSDETKPLPDYMST